MNVHLVLLWEVVWRTQRVCVYMSSEREPGSQLIESEAQFDIEFSIGDIAGDVCTGVGHAKELRAEG